MVPVVPFSVFRSRASRGLVLFSSLLAAASAGLAGSYPATGSQGFSYTDGTVPGTGIWLDGSSLSSTSAGDPPAPVASARFNALRLMADGVFNTLSAFKIPEIDPGQDISGFNLSFTLKFKAAGAAGSGMAVSFGAIPEDDGNGELGFSLPRGLEVAWETESEAPGQGQLVIYADRAKLATYPITIPSDDSFRTVSIIWNTTGLSVNLDGAVTVQNLAVPGFVPAVGDRLAFTARTGAAVSQEIAIDSLRMVTTPSASIVTGGPVISEFVADCKDSYEDDDLEASDWLEIFNGSGTAAPMAGWYLTDDPANKTKWPIPSFSLGANSYRVIFASGKNRSVTTGSLHTSFSLGKSAGYLALVRPDLTVASEYTYGQQAQDIPYGEVGAGRRRGYLETATPGAKNVSLVGDGPPAGDVVFSRAGGLLTGSAPVALSIASPSGAGAVVRYSVSQALPTEISPVYSAPFSITGTTTVRARVFQPGRLPGPVASRTFLKLDASLTNYNASGQVFSSNLPVIVFDSFGVSVDAVTSSGAARPYRPTYAVVVAPDKTTGRAKLDASPEYAGRSATHVRGESSADFAQKSYAWETWNNRDQDEDTAFLGFPAESDWVLHGPYSDKSMMRNHLIYSTFQDARADWFSPRTRFVEVFFNQQPNQPVSYSDYKGVYLLVEKIKRTSARVPLARLNPLVTAQPNVSGGYIFKKDKASLGSTNWSTTTGVPMQSVDPETFPTAQLNAIRSYVNSFETALNGANSTNPLTGYAAWIDADTFIDWQLAVEMSKQIDGYVFSTYFNKDRGGKMRAGPLWDFNISLGNADYAEGEYSTGWNYDASRTGALAGQLWFPKLLADPNYRTATFDRYWELRRGVWGTEAMMARIDAVSELLRDGNPTTITNSTALSEQSPIMRHFRLHKILGGRQWPNPASATTRSSFQAEVAAMKTWITERLTWIDIQSGMLSTSSRPPVMMRGEGANGSARISLESFGGVVKGTHFPEGVIYFTTNGEDPRPSGAKMPTSTVITALAEYGQASWLVPSVENGGRALGLAAWTDLADPPNAASWTAGQLGVGFEEQASSSSNPFKYHLAGAHPNDTAWTGGTSNLQSAMLGLSSSVFVRVPFTLTEDQLSRLARLQLRMRYDDGFIAYVNGMEAGRQNVKPETAAGWDTVADAAPANFTDAQGITGVTLDISHVIRTLKPGANMLAILAVNRSAADNDLLCSPTLLGALAVKPAGGAAITAPAYTGPFDVSANATVKARVYVPATGFWSSLASSTLIVGAQPASRENVVISEINYAPLPPNAGELASGSFVAADFEFVELLNTGTEPVDLTGVRVSGAVDPFNFSSAAGGAPVLPPGGRVVVCGNTAAFHARYGDNPAVKLAGEFSGNLNNSGETITLTDKDGDIIWSFAYKDTPPWPVVNDGMGFSLVLNNPSRHPAPDPALGSNWRAGPFVHGAPGLADSLSFTGAEGTDTDGDGMPDLLEYVFGSDPGSGTSTASPEARWEDGVFHLKVPRSAAADGFEWKIQASSDLTFWTDADRSLTGGLRDDAGLLWEDWSVVFPAAVEARRLFLRVNAELK